MEVVEHDNVGKGHTMWWCGQYIVRCRGWYIEEQSALYKGILEGPRKDTWVVQNKYIDITNKNFFFFSLIELGNSHLEKGKVTWLKS